MEHRQDRIILSFYMFCYITSCFDTLQNMMPKDAIIVSEGANTMDIGRTMLMNSLPKHR